MLSEGEGRDMLGKEGGWMELSIVEGRKERKREEEDDNERNK